jgi:hypothetical protein
MHNVAIGRHNNRVLPPWIAGTVEPLDYVPLSHGFMRIEQFLALDRAGWPAGRTVDHRGADGIA